MFVSLRDHVYTGSMLLVYICKSSYLFTMFHENVWYSIPSETGRQPGPEDHENLFPTSLVRKRFSLQLRNPTPTKMYWQPIAAPEGGGGHVSLGPYIIRVNKNALKGYLFRHPARNARIALTLKRLGYFGSWINWGGGGYKAPPLEISAVDRAITATICTMVVCDVIYKIVYLDFPK